MEAALQDADVTPVPPAITPHREPMEQYQYGTAARNLIADPETPAVHEHDAPRLSVHLLGPVATIVRAPPARPRRLDPRATSMNNLSLTSANPACCQGPAGIRRSRAACPAHNGPAPAE